jgi:hypothetical protein
VVEADDLFGFVLFCHCRVSLAYASGCDEMDRRSDPLPYERKGHRFVWAKFQRVYRSKRITHRSI